MRRITLLSLFAVAFVVIAVGTFYLLVDGHVSPTAFIVGLGAVWLVLFLCKDGIIIPDRTGDALVYRALAWVRDRRDDVRWGHVQSQNIRHGKRYKQDLRRVVAHLDQNGPASVESLAYRLDASTDAVSEWVRDLVARQWVSEGRSIADTGGLRGHQAGPPGPRRPRRHRPRSSLTRSGVAQAMLGGPGKCRTTGWETADTPDSKAAGQSPPNVKGSLAHGGPPTF